MLVVDMYPWTIPLPKLTPQPLVELIFKDERVATRICKVVKRANELGMPVFMCRNQCMKYHPRVEAAAGEGAYKFNKAEPDAFKDVSFTSELEARRVENLIIVGFHRSACVMETSMGALRNSLGVITSYRLMYGEYSMKGEFRKTLGFYLKNTQHYFSLGRLARKMRELSGSP